MATRKKKLHELSVEELRIELSERNLDKLGLKATLYERLEQAMVNEGKDQSKYLFELRESGTPKHVQTTAPGGTKTSSLLKDKVVKEEKIFTQGESSPATNMSDTVKNGSVVEVTKLLLPNGLWKTCETDTFKVKNGLDLMAKGGIIMHVTTPEEAKIAEEAEACAVAIIESVPKDKRREGGVARMIDLKKIEEIKNAVKIPVIAKVRIGHFAEAQILQALGVDWIEESELLTPADEENHIDKHAFQVPFICGAGDLGETLRRISEGAAMIRSKGEAGTDDVAEAVRHARRINRQIKKAKAMDSTEIYNYAKELCVSVDLLRKTAELGRLPVVNFAAGGIATPADVSLMMQLGVDGVFVGSGIFKSSNPLKHAKAMAQAVKHYKDPKLLTDCLE